MPAIAKSSIILVTGANGYVGTHVTEQLLEHGYRVRGTVRDEYKGRYLHDIFDEKWGADALDIHVVADMAVGGAFDPLLQGCAGVIHVASDLSLNPNPHKVIPMVISGVKNLLSAAARTPSIKRFVFTSSSAATTAPIVDKEFHVDSGTWNWADVELAWQPLPYTEDRRLAVYAASKTLAELECWRFMKEEKPSFILNTVLPNCVIGRILSSKLPASTGGWYKGLWDGNADDLHLLRHVFPPQHYVNATDTALLHIAALLEEDVMGERLLAFAGPFNFNDTVEILERLDSNGLGTGERRWERIENASKDLKTVNTARSQEILERYGRPGFTDLETCLKEAVTS
ncbi:hypothetical protein CBER1_06129 [Cercospora berteroae]|uniref:NAD-dependent epimerase/dehydratase domain-containing protein n=1 Tax=Cercospora berteroae TaxID=357750 RepID=A0A2S6C3K7_9PEZI|nr:hypothetical protein CBER1_06129 [Cercospora berteroae]